jgi:hypothetical protein
VESSTSRIQGPSGSLGVFDGEVRRVDLAAGTSTPFVSGLENPRGLAFTGEFLIAADQQKIYKIDQAGNATVLAKNTTSPSPPCSSTTPPPEHGGRAVFVTEMGRRDIIREPAWLARTPAASSRPDSDAAFAVPATSRDLPHHMDGKITSMFEPSRKLLVMNGVTEARQGQGNRLLATDFFHGNIVDVDLDHGTKNILATALRGADGLAQARTARSSCRASSSAPSGAWTRAARTSRCSSTTSASRPPPTSTSTRRPRSSTCRARRRRAILIVPTDI